jgi:hypothetical protein
MLERAGGMELLRFIRTDYERGNEFLASSDLVMTQSVALELETRSIST